VVIFTVAGFNPLTWMVNLAEMGVWLPNVRKRIGQFDCTQSRENYQVITRLQLTRVAISRKTIIHIAMEMGNLIAAFGWTSPA
jgi:hypothetical protein